MTPKQDQTDGTEDFAALLAEFEQKNKGRPRRGPVRVGDVVKGKIVSIGREGVFVDLGDGKADGMIDLEELRDESGQVTVAVGDSIEASVVENDPKAGCIVLRHRLGARGADARKDLEQAAQAGLPIEGVVSAAVKGGVEVQIGGVRGFCPVSQLDLRRVEDPAVFVGQKLSFKITQLETDRRGVNLVLSRRALLEADAKVRAAETRAKLSVGAVLSGTVTSIKDFGAFVDLGGIDGMLPASELGFQRGIKPQEVLTVGQQLQVQILRVERTDDARRPERISLSLRALERDPWEDVPSRFPAGVIAKGTVTRVDTYGAFVELAPGIEGLLHISQLSAGLAEGRPLRHARDVVKPGQTLDVTVLAVEPERRRVSLGIGARPDAVDAEDLAAARAVAAPTKLGTLGDLLKGRKL